MDASDYKDAQVIQSTEYTYDDDGNVTGEVHATFIPGGSRAKLSVDEQGDIIAHVDDIFNGCGDDDNDPGACNYPGYAYEYEYLIRQINNLADGLAKSTKRAEQRQSFIRTLIATAAGAFLGCGLVVLLSAVIR